MTDVAATKKEFRKAFYQDYLAKAATDAKGLTGIAVRATAAIGAKLLKWQMDPLGGFKMLGAGVLAIGTVVAGTLAAPPALVLGVLGGTTGIGLFAGFNVRHAASKAFKADLDNGTLAKRYDAEIVNPPKPAKKERSSTFDLPAFPGKGAAAKVFKPLVVAPETPAAATPEKAATPAVAAPEKPATPVAATPEAPK